MPNIPSFAQVCESNGLRLEPLPTPVIAQNTKTGAVGLLTGWWISELTGSRIMAEVVVQTAWTAADVVAIATLAEG